jgi:hypothetical protein
LPNCHAGTHLLHPLPATPHRPAPAGEAEGSHNHTSRWVSTAACNVQTIGRDVLYTPRLETRLKTGRRNKVAVGALFSKLGEDYSHPFKVTRQSLFLVWLICRGLNCGGLL